MTLKNLGKEKLLPKIVAAAALVWLLVVMVGCTNNADAATPKHETPSKPEEPKYLASRVGYDELKLHGKFRQYEVNTAKGDRTDKYSDGSQNGLFDMPAGAIATKDGKTIETPTYWSRIPLSIQPTPGTNENDKDCEKGLYSIHTSGTSLIFPLPYNGVSLNRDDVNNRQCTAGVYVAFATTSSKIKLHYKYISTAGGRGRSGIDIYEIENGKPVYKKNLRENKQDGIFEYNTGNSNSDLKKFMVVLPTYNGFKFDANDETNPSGLAFEFDEDAKTYEIEVFNESKQKPILIYGTSVTQGDGNAGLRPGACYTAQIMFATNREVINMGVAGSAQLEYKMADFLANIKSEVFIIDPTLNLRDSDNNNDNNQKATVCGANGAPANITNNEIIARVKYMVKKYREKNPDTPIVLCPRFIMDQWSVKGSKTLPSTISIEGFTASDNQYTREGFLMLKAYTELKNGTNGERVDNIYFAEQGYDGTNNAVRSNNIHPPVNGMTDIANFILRTFKRENALQHLYNGEDLVVPAT